MRETLNSRVFAHTADATKLMGLSIAAVAITLIVGCSGMSPEAKLNDRATEVYNHVTKGDWEAVHSYFLPEFQRFCPVEKYTEKNIKGMKVLKHMLGIPEEKFLEFSVIETNVYGSTGQVYIDISYLGKSLDLGQSKSPREWVLVENKWWSNPEDWDKDCS